MFLTYLLHKFPAAHNVTQHRENPSSSPHMILFLWKPILLQPLILPPNTLLLGLVVLYYLSFIAGFFHGTTCPILVLNAEKAPVSEAAEMDSPRNPAIVAAQAMGRRKCPCVVSFPMLGTLKNILARVTMNN